MVNLWLSLNFKVARKEGERKHSALRKLHRRLYTSRPVHVTKANAIYLVNVTGSGGSFFNYVDQILPIIDNLLSTHLPLVKIGEGIPLLL